MTDLVRSLFSLYIYVCVCVCVCVCVYGTWTHDAAVGYSLWLMKMTDCWRLQIQKTLSNARVGVAAAESAKFYATSEPTGNERGYGLVKAKTLYFSTT